MNRLYWLLPVALILIIVVSVVVLNQRDVTPEMLVPSEDPTPILSEADALRLLDSQREAFDSYAPGDPLPPQVLRAEGGLPVSLIVAETADQRVTITRGGVASPWPLAANVASRTSSLIGGWTYQWYALKPLTEADAFARAAQSADSTLNTDAALWQLVEADDGIIGACAEQCKGPYAVIGQLTRADGSAATVVIDANTCRVLDISTDK